MLFVFASVMLTHRGGATVGSRGVNRSRLKKKEILLGKLKK